MFHHRLLQSLRPFPPSLVLVSVLFCEARRLRLAGDALHLSGFGISDLIFFLRFSLCPCVCLTVTACLPLIISLSFSFLSLSLSPSVCTSLPAFFYASLSTTELWKARCHIKLTVPWSVRRLGRSGPAGGWVLLAVRTSPQLE